MTPLRTNVIVLKQFEASILCQFENAGPKCNKQKGKSKINEIKLV